MKRVQKLSFYDGSVEMEETTHILDFVTSFVDTYGDIAYESLPGLLKCTQAKEIPNLPHDLSLWTSWIEQSYIPKEPNMLSPGTMSNAPDRLDGFHTFNRCCRSTADKGRSKENLASYSTDRRAFENWSDGNWITANKLMGFINSNPSMKKSIAPMKKTVDTILAHAVQIISGQYRLASAIDQSFSFFASRVTVQRITECIIQMFSV